MSLFSEQFKYNARLGLFYTSQAIASVPPFQRIAIMFCIIALLPAYWITRVASNGYYRALYYTSEVEAHPSFENPKAVVTGPVKLLSAGTNSYSAYVQIKNENDSLAARTGNYKFTFSNKQGEQIYTTGGKFYMLPGQTKYLVVPRFNATEPVSSSSVEISEVAWQNRIEIPKVALSKSLPQTYNQPDPQAFVVEGTISNDSPYNVGDARITYLLYNTNNNIISVSQRDEFNLRPQERRAYKQLWPGVFTTDIGKVDVVLETNVLDPTNVKVENANLNSGGLLKRPTDNQDSNSDN